MLKRGRPPGKSKYQYETGEGRSAFGEHLHKLYKDKTGKKLSQTHLAKAMGIPAPTLTLMLKKDKELVRSERLYLLFKNLAQLPEQEQMTLFEDQARELLGKIEDDFNEEQEKALLRRLTQELIVKREYTTRYNQLPFLGRDEDIQKILDTLLNGKKQWLTIVGVPGVGKSELAWQVREQVRKYEDFFTPEPISFDNVTSAEEVEQLITNALARRDRRQKTLLVLNDCEQITAIPDAFEKIIDFYNDDPFLTILATSRVDLGTQKYPPDPDKPLASLAVPEEITDQAKQLEKYDAIQLFRESAKRIDSRFRLTDQNASDVAALCIGLGGLPLAMIIAGSLVDELTLEELYKRLLDKTPNKNIQDLETRIKQPQKHKRLFTLNALISVSYDLLGKDAEHGKQLQALFRRLGLFINECEVEAVAAACSLDNDVPTDPKDSRLTNLLTKLADHHLITNQNNWIHIAHVTLRDYALRKVGKKETLNFYLQIAQYYCLFALHYALSHKTKEAREMLSLYYNKQELEALAEYWRDARHAERKKTKEAWSEVIQKQHKDIEVAYWAMSWLRLIYIEQETARILGEEEDTAWQRIRAFGFKPSSHVNIERLQNMENALHETGGKEEGADLLIEALDAVAQATENIENVIEEAPSEYFAIREKVEQDRNTLYHPFYSLLKHLLEKEEVTHTPILPVQVFRSKPPYGVMLDQVQFHSDVHGIIIFNYIYAAGGVKGPIPLTLWINPFMS